VATPTNTQEPGPGETPSPTPEGGPDPADPGGPAPTPDIPNICGNVNLPTLSISASPAQGLPGTQSVFIVRASNPHTSEVNALSLTTSFTPGAEVTGARSNLGQPSFTPGGSSVTLGVGNLPAGQTVEIVIDVRLADNVAPGSTVAANVSANVVGYDCTQSSASVTITPLGIPVTGFGPGWAELRALLIGGLSLLALLLVAGFVVTNRAARPR
jgi:hypothetical protein